VLNSVNDATPIVFVVDDDESMRNALRRLLTSAGLPVEAFPTARAFLSSPRPDAPACLVLDVRLPDLNGLDLQKHLVQAGMSLPIVFLTGHGDIPMSVRAMKAGAVEFLTKPFRPHELLEAIRHALDSDRKLREQVKAPLAEERQPP
jgi:FixJ family two-component response regulator